MFLTFDVVLRYPRVGFELSLARPSLRGRRSSMIFAVYCIFRQPSPLVKHCHGSLISRACFPVGPKVLLNMLKAKEKGGENFLLVVSIDNLDRCPHREIVKVLEAVHLLLEHDQVRIYCGGSYRVLQCAWVVP